MIRWIAVFLITTTASAAGLAHEFRTKDITVTHPWTRATMAPGQAAAIYMEIVNEGTESETLLSAETPVAEMTMLHRTVSEGGIARMIAVEELKIGAGESVVLEPNGLHLMLTGMAIPLVMGESFPLTLRFMHAGEVVITVAIEGMERNPPSHHAHTPSE